MQLKKISICKLINTDKGIPDNFRFSDMVHGRRQIRIQKILMSTKHFLLIPGDSSRMEGNCRCMKLDSFCGTAMMVSWTNFLFQL